MVNPFKEVNWNPDTAARRTFAKSLIIGFPCLAILLLLAGCLAGKGWQVSPSLKLGGFGAGAGVVFYLLPGIAKPFYCAWYALACCMGLVIGNLVLVVIFYVLVTGIGLAKRLFVRPAMRMKPDPALKTYWLDAPSASNPQRYFSQY